MCALLMMCSFDGAKYLDQLPLPTLIRVEQYCRLTVIVESRVP